MLSKPAMGRLVTARPATSAPTTARARAEPALAGLSPPALQLNMEVRRGALAARPADTRTLPLAREGTGKTTTRLAEESQRSPVR
jgi:hypothetical protein